MAVDMFLKIQGIPGESSDSKHKDEIDILSFQWGVSQVGAEFGGAGKVSVQDFSFTHVLDKASPKLFLACVTGEHIKEAMLTVRKAVADRDQLEYLKYGLSDILVTKVEQAGSSDPPMESVSLNFIKFEIMYTPVDATGKLLPAVQAGFDFKRRRAF